MAWYEQAVFYHIYPLGLTGAPKKNPYGEPVHRLNALIPWIDHIREIGCTGLYRFQVFFSCFQPPQYRLTLEALRAMVLAPMTSSMPTTLFIISAAEAMPLWSWVVLMRHAKVEITSEVW